MTRQTQHTRFHTTSRSCARTHRTALLVRRRDKPRLRFGWPSLFSLSLLAILLATSRPDSGAEQLARPHATSLPASDLRQQVLAVVAIRHLYAGPYALLYTPIFFAAPSPCLSTLLYASTRSSLRSPSHSRRARGAQVSSPRPPGARASTPVSPLLLSRPPSISQVGFPLLLPPGVTSSPHVTWTNRCATTLNLALSLRIPILPHLSLFFSSLIFFSLPCKGITHRSNAVDELRHRAYLFFHSDRVPTSATAPSSRIGPIACQAASSAPARPLRRCR